MTCEFIPYGPGNYEYIGLNMNRFNRADTSNSLKHIWVINYNINFYSITILVQVNGEVCLCQHEIQKLWTLNLYTRVIVKLGHNLTAILALVFHRVWTLCQSHVKTTSLHCDCQAKVKSSSFCFPTPLLMLSVWIKAVCVSKVSGFPSSVTDAASQISLVHTTYQE